VTAPISREWQFITATVSPPIIGEQAMAYLPPINGGSEGGRVVLYGGNATGWPYETTTWEFDGTTWYPVAIASHPQARYGAAMAYHPGTGLLLFGGSDENDTALNQTWVYTNAAWSQVATTGPANRTYASLSGSKLLLVVGVLTPKKRTKVHTTNPNLDLLSLVFASSPPRLFLFGGNNGETCFNDLWKYENGGWTNITPATSPPARTLAATTYDMDNDQLLLFGGRSLTSTVLADFWAFDLATEIWTPIAVSGGPHGPQPDLRPGDRQRGAGGRRSRQWRHPVGRYLALPGRLDGGHFTARAGLSSGRSREPGYNGGRADLGAYGNTLEATQIPPLSQMGVILDTTAPLHTGRPGEMISYTLTLRNSGVMTDSYLVDVKGS
jgi:hypothetical protein